MSGFFFYLFDLDRTLIDTHEYIEACVSHTIRTLGGIDRRTHKSYGLSLDAFYRVVNPDGDIEEYKRVHMDFQKKNLHLAKLFPNTLHVLQELRNRKKICGLVTSRQRDSVEEMKRHFGLEGFFVYESTITEVGDERRKPHPEGILKGMQVLKHAGVLCHNTVMVGDSNEDLLAARRAEVVSVWTSEGVQKDEPKPETEPHYHIKDISEVLSL
jgi:phosphoglycolate phosphatase